MGATRNTVLLGKTIAYALIKKDEEWSSQKKIGSVLRKLWFLLVKKTGGGGLWGVWLGKGCSVGIKKGREYGDCK